MKRLIATILLVAVIVSGIAVPEKKASAYGWSINSETGEITGKDDDDNIVYYRDADGNVLIDNRVLDAEIVNSEGAHESGRKKITAGFGEQFICRIYKTEFVSNYVDEVFDILWYSSDADIASVDKNGFVTGKKAGKATITAEITANKQKVTKEITVIKNQIDLHENKGDAYQRNDFISYDKNGNLVWTMKITNNSKKKYLYIMDDQTFEMTGLPDFNKNNHVSVGYNKKYKFYGETSDLMFTLKPGKTKTIKLTKKNLKKKYKNLNLAVIAEEGSSFIDQGARYYSWNIVKKAQAKAKKGKVVDISEL